MNANRGKHVDLSEGEVITQQLIRPIRQNDLIPIPIPLKAISYYIQCPNCQQLGQFSLDDFAANLKIGYWPPPVLAP